MFRTLTITGSLGVYLSAVMILHCSTEVDSKMEIEEPKIVKLRQIRRHTSSSPILTCRVNPGGLIDETLVYWLANGDFLESTYKNISVKKRERKSQDGTVFLHSTVEFKDLSQSDFQTTFTCVALNPYGFDKRNIQLRPCK